MNEENRDLQHPSEEAETAPQMSEISSLASIFFEPGRTFEFLRSKPKFIVGGLIIIVLTMAFQNLFMYRLGETRIKREVMQQLDKNPQIQSMPADQKNKIVEQQLTISNIISRYAFPIIVIIIFGLIALLYWLGVMVMGGSARFWQILSVTIYSAFPPTVVAMLANILILFLKDVDDIALSDAQRGLVKANPSMFFDGKEMPVLTTLISTIDVFQIWGWVLAAIGLRIVGKMSNVSAWSVVAILALIGISFRVLSAVFSGNPS